MEKRYTDVCPETGGQQTVSVTFAEVRSIGIQGYKAVRHRCDCADCSKDLFACPLASAVITEAEV